MICAKFARKSTKKELTGLFREINVEEGSSSMLLLHRFLNRVCQNCQHYPCINGSELSKENFVKDAIIGYTDGIFFDINIRKTISFEDEGQMIKYSVKPLVGVSCSYRKKCDELKYRCK